MSIYIPFTVRDRFAGAGISVNRHHSLDAQMANEAADAVPVTQRGRVKLFSLERGYGFVKPDGGGPDLYILRANIEKPKGFLRVGDYVCFQVTKTDKGPQVLHIRAIKDDGSEVSDGTLPCSACAAAKRVLSFS
jgi:cold shock protein